MDRDSLLTKRELEVLASVGHGKSNREIADLLFITGNTVKAHLKEIMAKLKVKNRLEAVDVARINNLLPNTSKE